MQIRAYQSKLIEQASAILDKHKIVYLALETRVGKTPVSLISAQNSGKAEILFCTKKSVIPDINKTLTRLREANIMVSPVKVVSFDSLHKEAWTADRCIIIDEAHSFGAYPKPSKRAKMLRLITRSCPVILLSATPTPESYSEIYHQLWACNAYPFADYGTFYKWAKVFVNVKQKFIGAGTLANDYSDAKWDMIHDRISPFVLSYTQADAGFEFEVTEKVVQIACPDALKSIIRALRKDRLYYHGSSEIVAETAASLMSKIHQLYSGTVIDEQGGRHIISTHKIAYLKLLLTFHKKLAVYYKFIAELDMLKAEFGERITSDADEFAKDNSLIYAGQFCSKREGINLKTAEALVFFNMDYAFVSYWQTLNRIQDIARDSQPILYLLFTKGGIEEKIYELVRDHKKNYTVSHFKKTGREL